MKKALSIILALIILISSLSISFVSYSADKPCAEDKLVDVQKINGFIPGKTAKITGNCYGFISAVCEKLHGIKYDGEGLYGNYKARHETENYYTVKTYETKSTSMSESIAKNIRDFFIANAQPGDVVHYGAYTNDTGNYSTHTFMIQHIDREKMQIYHSNYETRLDDRNDCHIDTIIWENFIKNPTKTIYNSDDTVYSFNSMFYLKMKSSGLGISINRLSNYNDKYTSVNISAQEPIVDEEIVEAKLPEKVMNLASTSVTTTSISIKWDEVENADEYYVYIKNDTKGTTFGKTVEEISTSLNNFTPNNTYSIKVRAINSVGKGTYSDILTVNTKKTTPKVTKLLATDSTTSTISYSWKKITGATKYYLEIKNVTKGGKYSKTVTTNSATIKGLTEGNVYSVKVKAYTKDGSWGAYSSTLTTSSKPAKAKISSLTSPSKSKMKVKWKKAAGNKTGYQICYSTDKSFKKNVEKKNVGKASAVSYTLSGLKKGKKYYVRIRTYVKYDKGTCYGSWSTVKSIKSK